jgi:hypothetical protein
MRDKTNRDRLGLFMDANLLICGRTYLFFWKGPQRLATNCAGIWAGTIRGWE